LPELTWSLLACVVGIVLPLAAVWLAAPELADLA